MKGKERRNRRRRNNKKKTSLRYTGQLREERGREECLLCIQPRLRSHSGHPDCGAVGTRVTV